MSETQSLKNIIKYPINKIYREILNNEDGKKENIPSFEKYISEKYIGYDDADVIFEKASFPIIVDSLYQQSNEGYHGGTSYTKIIIGNIIKTIDKKYDEDQYTSSVIEKLLVDDVDGLVVLYDYNSWYGSRKITIYYQDDETLNKLKEEYRNYKQKIIKDIDEKIREKFNIKDDEKNEIKNKIKKIFENAAKIVYYSSIDTRYCNDEYFVISIYDEKGSEICKIYYSDSYCNGNIEFYVKMHIGDFNAYYRYVYDCDWVQKGYAGPSILICDEDITFDNLWLFKIMVEIVNELPDIKFILEVNQDEDYTDDDYCIDEEQIWKRIK